MGIYVLYGVVVVFGAAMGGLFTWLINRDDDEKSPGRRGIRRGGIRWGRVTEIRHHARGTRNRTHDGAPRARRIAVASHRLGDLNARYRVPNFLEDTMLVEDPEALS